MFGFNFNLKGAIGKTKTRSQMGMIGTDDGRLVDIEVPVLKGCMASDNLCAGWVLDADNQFQDEKTGAWFQIVGDRSCIPVCVITKTKVTDLEALVNKIFHNSWVTDLITAGRDVAADKQRQWIYFICGAPILICAVAFAVSMFN